MKSNRLLRMMIESYEVKLTWIGKNMSNLIPSLGGNALTRRVCAQWENA